jgi:hypothetical protein
MRILKAGLFIIMILVSELSLATQDSFVRPAFSPDLYFTSFYQAAGQWIPAREFKVFYYDEARAKCDVVPERLGQLMSSFNSWRHLESWFPGGALKWERLRVVVGIDYFGANVSQSSGYFLENQPVPHEHLIVLDCRLFETDEWQARLLHEITHAILKDQSPGLPVWFEEMVAQSVEVAANPEKLNRMVVHLQASHSPMRPEQPTPPTDVLPSPLRAKGSFVGNSRYGLNLLLARYLRAHFAANLALDDDAATRCLTGSQGLRAGLDCWLTHAVTKGSSKLGGVLAGSPTDFLLKHFYLALMIAQDEPRSRGLFAVPGWRGFRSVPPRSLAARSLEVESLGAARLHPALAQKLLPQLSEGFFVAWVKKAYNVYDIFDQKTLSVASDHELDEGEVLIVNLTDKSQILRVR